MICVSVSRVSEYRKVKEMSKSLLVNRKNSFTSTPSVNLASRLSRFLRINTAYQCDCKDVCRMLALVEGNRECISSREGDWISSR